MDIIIKDNLYMASPGSKEITVEDKAGSTSKLVNHGTTGNGHTWGYDGGGPTQLATDLLWDHMGVQPTPWLAIQFREAFVSTIPANAPFEVDTATITRWLLKWTEMYPDEQMGMDGL